MQEISVIFPCYNEAERLPQLFKALEKFSIPETKIHYIFVDDASIDGSPKLVEEWILKNAPDISAELLAKTTNEGKGPAIVSGDAIAKTKLRLFTDVDLSTPLSAIPEALQKFNASEPELLIGSRHAPGAELAESQGILRLALGRAFSFFTSVFHQSAFSDTQCGFKLWTKKFSENVVQQVETSRWSFDIAWIMKAESENYFIEEMPVRWTNDERSKVSAVKDGLTMAGDVLKYRLLYGSKWALLLGMLMFVLGFSMAMRSSNDMHIYLNKAWLPLSQGMTDIYEPLRKSQGAYYYSPLFALLGVPFAWVSVGTSKALYYLLYIVLALSGWVFVRRLIRYSGFKFKAYAAIPAIFLIALMNNHFGQALSGNLSGQIASLIMASGYFYLIGMKKTAAWTLALAINFKVYPAFLLLFFLLRKDFVFLLQCFVASFIFLLLPAFFVGWDLNLQMHLEQIASLKAYGPQNDYARDAYQSWSAMFVRVARAWSLDEGLAMRIAQGTGILAVIAYGLSIRNTLDEKKEALLLWCFSLLVLGLIAPASWVHHFGFIYAPAILFVLGHIYSQGVAKWQSKAGVLLIIFVALYSFTTEGVVGKGFNDFLESYSVPTLGILALLMSYLNATFREIHLAKAKRVA